MQVQVNNYKLADGTEGSVAIVNRALVEFDLVRAKRKWPTIAEAPFVFQTFTTWKALNLEGSFPGTYDQFLDACLDIEPQEVEDVDPTRTGTDGDS